MNDVSKVKVSAKFEHDCGHIAFSNIVNDPNGSAFNELFASRAYHLLFSESYQHGGDTTIAVSIEDGGLDTLMLEIKFNGGVYMDTGLLTRLILSVIATHEHSDFTAYKAGFAQEIIDEHAVEWKAESIETFTSKAAKLSDEESVQEVAVEIRLAVDD